MEYYTALQYTLFETGYPETIDRTDTPRTEETAEGVTVTVLATPVECIGLLLEGTVWHILKSYSFLAVATFYYGVLKGVESLFFECSSTNFSCSSTIFFARARTIVLEHERFVLEHKMCVWSSIILSMLEHETLVLEHEHNHVRSWNFVPENDMDRAGAQSLFSSTKYCARAGTFLLR